MRAENTTIVAGAVGLRPSQHAELHLAAEAVRIRLEKEHEAARRIVRAVRHFTHRRLQHRILAAIKICRAMLGHNFKTNRRHPDQVPWTTVYIIRTSIPPPRILSRVFTFRVFYASYQHPYVVLGVILIVPLQVCCSGVSSFVGE